MSSETEIIKNKISESGLVSIDLKDFYPEGERVIIDMKDHLFEGLILKEKDFRQYVKTEDWSKYKNKYVAITSTADAIIPTWAYMLLSSELQAYAKKVVCGTPETLEAVLFHDTVNENLKPGQYADKRVMIKGCGDKEIPASAFVEATAMLKPFVKSIMYGEACSNVPIYKSRSEAV
jgi:Protein of unknown function (DUF2480)